MPGSPIMEEEVFESSPDFFLEIYLGFEELNNALKIEFPEFRERDLHLAAELGKTLLERNKELENSIKNYQSTIDDQALEIEYLKKQVAAMKEVNNSRLKVYENLETVINDLEHMNQQLESERSKDKNKITSLRKMIDEIQNRYHDLEDKYETIKRDQKTSNAPTSPNHRLTQDGSIQIDAVSTSSSSDPEADDAGALRRRLQEAHEQRNSVQQKVAALAEQIASLTQERTETQEQLRELESELAGLKKDNAYLEQIRKSQMCRECKAVIDRGDETPSLRIDDDVIDECSLHESLGHMGYEDPSFALQAEIEVSKPKHSFIRKIVVACLWKPLLLLCLLYKKVSLLTLKVFAKLLLLGWSVTVALVLRPFVFTPLKCIGQVSKLAVGALSAWAGTLLGHSSGLALWPFKLADRILSALRIKHVDRILRLAFYPVVLLKRCLSNVRIGFFKL